MHIILIFNLFNYLAGNSRGVLESQGKIKPFIRWCEELFFTFLYFKQVLII